jgi:hypothetical protein
MFPHVSTLQRASIRKKILSLRALTLWLVCGLCLLLLVPSVAAQRKRRAPAGGQTAVVVDERLSALREEARLNARLVQRLGRGRMVSIIGARRGGDGVDFYRVAVTSRTRGWLQRESCRVARAGRRR